MPEAKESTLVFDEELETKKPETKALVEDEFKEADFTVEHASAEVRDFAYSGFRRAAKIASEMDTEVDSETKTALEELNRQAELARQMLAGSFGGKLRLKSADYLKKYLPASRLTALAERKNTDTISKKAAARLEELLKNDNGDYEQTGQAADYFAKHKHLLDGEERKRLENRVLEAGKVREERKAELLSKKTVEELQALLEYEKGDYKEAEKAVNYFLQHKNLPDVANREASVFEAVEVHLGITAGDYYNDGSWQDALAEYKRMPGEFFKNKDISRIGNYIYSQAKRKELKPKEILAAFAGHLELVAAGSRYAGREYSFSSEDRVKIVSETYEKLGPSKYVAIYDAYDFDGREDRQKVLKPLFESYRAFNTNKILSEIDEMGSLLNALPPEEHAKVIKELTEKDALKVFNKFDLLNLNEEEVKFLAGQLRKSRQYTCFESEENLKKLNVSKEEIFDELLEKDAAYLFARRGIFKPTPEQYKLILDRVTNDIGKLREVLRILYADSYDESKQVLTEGEMAIFAPIVEKSAPGLVIRYKRVFENIYLEKLGWFFTGLQGLSTNELERFVNHVEEDLGGWEKNTERVRALVAESGEQKVTREYLEQLDGLDLKLPTRVKGKIKENIKKAERSSLLDYFRLALANNQTLEQAQREIQQKMEQVTANSDYFKAVHLDVLQHILKDRRFKTQFETHSSNGSLDPSFRARQEEKMFNYVGNKDKNKRVRPNYGYMSDNKNGIVGSFSKTSVYSTVGSYGHIHVKFKKQEIKDRTTVTFEDSLSNADQSPPTPSVKPHFTTLNLNRSTVRNMSHSSTPNDWGSSYLEVQYHWPLRTSLIESIHISEKNNLTVEQIREIQEMVIEYNMTNPNDKIKVVVY